MWLDPLHLPTCFRMCSSRLTSIVTSFSFKSQYTQKFCNLEFPLNGQVLDMTIVAHRIIRRMLRGDDKGL